MSFDVSDLIDGVRASRLHFLKHLKGLRADQWDWKPYPACKSIRETVLHLIVDDRAAVQSLETGKEPDYEGITDEVTAEAGGELDAAMKLLEDSHERLCAYLGARYVGLPLDTEISIWGSPRKLGAGVGYLSSEDFYHAGQVSFIRMATDPDWDYYGHVYGP